MKTYRQYIVEAQGHQIRVSYKEHRAAVKLAKKFSVPFEDLLAFLNVPHCALILPTAEIKMLDGFDLNVTALDHRNEGRLSLVRQTRFRSVSAEVSWRNCKPSRLREPQTRWRGLGRHPAAC